jgi:serine protease Do
MVLARNLPDTPVGREEKMGYYDEHYDYGKENPERKPRGGYFLASLLGAVIGAAIIFFAIPFLMRQDWFPFPQDDASVTENAGSGGTINRSVSVDVNTDITKAVEKVSDTVVGITNIQNSDIWLDSQPGGTGSGVIYKKAGGKAYIVTNYHVVEGANRLEVTLPDETKLAARLVGSDMWTDLAVVEVDGSKIKKVAEFGNSDKLKLGEPVIAIGNPLGLNFAGSVTQGIISGINRTVPLDFNSDGVPDWNAEVIQTDAAINPGNSGGALANISGQVVGINSMKIAQEEVEGIGFAIPINSVIPIIEDIEKYGEVKRPYMGVQLQDISEIPVYYQERMLKLPRDVHYGLVIVDVVPNSPADKAGLRRYDVIVKLDGKEVKGLIDLRKHLYVEKEIGDKMTVGFYREGKYREVTLTLSEETL